MFDNVLIRNFPCYKKDLLGDYSDQWLWSLVCDPWEMDFVCLRGGGCSPPLIQSPAFPRASQLPSGANYVTAA